jgi:NTE family protein
MNWAMRCDAALRRHFDAEPQLKLGVEISQPSNFPFVGGH